MRISLRPMKISLKRMIYAGYAGMLFFIFFISIITIYSLNTLRKDFDSIVSEGMPVAELLSKLSDSLVEQDLYEKKFIVLKDSDMEDLFWSRSNEFNELMNRIKQKKSPFEKDIQTISQLHDEYDELFNQQALSIETNETEESKQISRKMRSHFSKISSLIRDLNVKTRMHINQKINNSNVLVENTFNITIISSFLASAFGITFAFYFVNYIIRSIENIKNATAFIKNGDYDKIPKIGGINEFAELSVSFEEMTSRLKELETMNLDANPLTKLPGNLAIEKELLIRFKESSIFSFCLLDLDNFKAYSDKYGYARGSDVLEWLGNLIKKITARFGTVNDFVGHIGGDDFVLISEPIRVIAICKNIINEFDHLIKNFYNDNDRENGYIISVNRQNVKMKFPIMTLSIAIVSNDKCPISNPREVAERIADLKKYAKSFPKSIYVVERRRER